MDDITVKLTKEEVIYLENLLMLDKLSNLDQYEQNGWSEEIAGYIKTDEELYLKLKKAWK